MFIALLAPFRNDPLAVDSATREAVGRLEEAWAGHGPRRELVAAAVSFAVESHRGQRRESGELYVSHPLQVAAIVASWGFDEVSVAAACCHDVLEDCQVSLEVLSSRIGAEAAAVVDGVSKVGRLHLSPGEDVSSASMTKFLVAVVSDVRVLAVKLADRLHNLRTSTVLSADRRLRSATEALEVFAPLAHRLGLEEPRREMEDLAFAIKMPESYTELYAALEKSSKDRHRVEASILREIAKIVAESGLDAEVESRTKHLYSIHLKLQTTGVPPESLHDLVGARIVLADGKECYTALGLVHANFTPVPGRFKDYIALPRPSGYRSLHTTVLYEGVEVEVQIRSEEMHQQARYGVAAHYLYKHGRSRHGVVNEELAADLASAPSPEAFLERLREDLAPQSEVVVLTPKGKPVVLPRSATVLDFAYKIHTDVGHRCTGAKVNGSLVPIRSTLRTGDVVEVLTGTKAAPSRDWLQVVVSARAREKIRKFLEESSADPIGEGRQILAEELRHRGYGHLLDNNVLLARIASANGFSETGSLFKALSAGDREASRLLGLPDRPTPRRSTPAPVSNFEALVARALGGLPCTFPRCCNPSNLESATGLVSRMHEISVHSNDCLSLAATVRDLPLGEFSRLMSLESGDTFAWLEVRSLDRVGLLRDVLEVLVGFGADIAWSSVLNGEVALLRFRFAQRVPSRSDALRTLRALEGVFEVYVA